MSGKDCFFLIKPNRLLIGWLLLCAWLTQSGCLTRQVQKTNVPPPPKVVTQDDRNNKPQSDSSKPLPPTSPSTPNNNSTGSATKPPLLPPIKDPATPPISPPQNTPTADTTAIEPTLPDNNPAKINLQTDIVLMLPFNLPIYRAGMNTDSLPEKSKVALDFYAGVLCGLDYLRSQGITPNVKLLDSENNPAKVKTLLADPTLSAETDLIIGPIYNSEIKDVATFAKQNKIYQVSPLSPSNQNAQDNPYYIIANPSVEMHCKAMFDYISATMLNSQIIAVSGSKTADQALAARFGQFAAAKKGDGIVSYLVNTLNFNAGITPTSELETLMSPTRRNVFVVTSYNDEALIIDLSNKLLSLAEKYDIAIFGMPNWPDLPNLPLDVLAQLNFHYTTAYWDNQSSEIQQFKQSFYNKFKTYPSEYAGRGYDLICYFGQTLKSKNSNENSSNLNDRTGLFTDFKFRSTTVGLNKNQYIENNHVNIIRFRPDYILEKANR